MPDTAAQPLSSTRAFLAENFLKKIARRARASNPTQADWIRGISGWPHPESAGSAMSYLLIPFEALLNTLKLLIYIGPTLAAMRLMDDALIPTFDTALEELSGNGRGRGHGALKMLQCAPLLLLMSSFAAVALTGGALTATSNLFEKGHAFGAQLHPKLAKLFGGYVFLIALMLHILVGLDYPVAMVGLISLKLMTYSNESIQNGVSGVFMPSYSATVPNDTPASEHSQTEALLPLYHNAPASSASSSSASGSPERKPLKAPVIHSPFSTRDTLETPSYGTMPGFASLD